MTDSGHAGTPIGGSDLGAQAAPAATAAAATLSSAASSTVPRTSPSTNEAMHTQESSMSDSPATLAAAAPTVVSGEQPPSASLAPLPPAASAQAESQARTVRNGRDIGERSGSTPSSAPITTAQGAMLLPPHSPTDSSQLQTHLAAPALNNPSPNVAAGDLRVAPASAAPAAASSASSTAAPSPFTTAASSSSAPVASAAPVSSSNGLASSNMSSSAASVVAGTTAAATSRVSAAPVDRHAASNSAFASMFKQCLQASARPLPSVASSVVDDVLGGPAVAAASQGLRRAGGLDRLHGIHICHCLVFDTALFAMGGDDSKKHSAVLAASADEVRSLVLAWQEQLVSASVACVMVRSARVHVQFRTHADMAVALKTSPLLVQCGVVALGWGAKECGPARHDRPEKLELTCTPNDRSPHSAAEVPAAITRLLKEEMRLEYTSQWTPSQYDPTRVGTGYIAVSVLPRAIGLADLTATVERLNAAKHQLWGGTVHVHAPNTPSLARCKECGKLGHQSSACPRYAGVALRLLFKQPAPFAMLLALCDQMSARSESFLGHDALVLPHRKMTLLFDSKETVDLHIKSLMEQYGRLMHEAPRIVDVQNRLKECHECGSLTKIHECPFPQLRYGQQTVAAQQQKPKQQGGAPAAAATAAAASASAPAAANVAGPVDNMCKSWRLKRECPRRRRGERCRFTHPDSHVIQEKVCFAFQQNGVCARGEACKFPHRAAPQQQQQQQQLVVAVAVPVAVPAAVPAAGGVAAPMVATVAAGAAVATRAVTAPVSASKKKRNKAAQQEKTENSQRADLVSRRPAASPARAASTGAVAAVSEGGTSRNLKRKTSHNDKEDRTGSSSWADESAAEEQLETSASSSTSSNGVAAAGVMRQSSAPPISSLGLLTSPHKQAGARQAPASNSSTSTAKKARSLDGAMSAEANRDNNKESNDSGKEAAAAAAPSRSSSSTRH